MRPPLRVNDSMKIDSEMQVDALPALTVRRGATRWLIASACLVWMTGMVLAQVPAVPSAAKPAPPPLTIPDAPKPVTAKAWLVMDDATGKVLAGENIDMRLEPASITKVMTSYVIAAELKAGRIKPTDKVRMSENAWRTGGAATEGSYSGFEVNKTADLTEMVKGMVVQSGNDAAIALAEHTAGSEAAFATLMNDYAKRLGMKNSRFMNSHGLAAEGHYSSAHDLAILGRALIRDFPVEYSYNRIREFTVGPITQRNRNLLLWRDESVDGIKTGHLSTAGYCLMSSAKRGDQRLISVVMGAKSEEERAVDSLALLNWGFRFYETHRLYQGDVAIATHKVWKGTADTVKLGLRQPLLVSTPRGRYADLKPQIDVPKTLGRRHRAGDAGRQAGDRSAADRGGRRGRSRFLQTPVARISDVVGIGVTCQRFEAGQI
jgi:serine-type D-Ala-D-Ala carboxypeptidase (penicillin-binding protein 5/6)